MLINQSKACGRDGSRRLQTIISKASITPCTDGAYSIPSLLWNNHPEYICMSLSSQSSTLSPIFLSSLAPWKMYWGFQICVYLYNMVTNWRGWRWRHKVTAQGASRSVLSFRFWLHVTHNHGCGVLWACNCSSCHIPDSALPPGMDLWNDLHWRGKWSFQQVCCAYWGARDWRRQAHVHNMAGK